MKARTLRLTMVICLGCFFGLIAKVAIAQEHVATITRFYGKVAILSNPSGSVKGNAPHAKFEGEYYSVKKAKTGAKLERGNIIQTGPRSRVRLIYDNGDQVSVSPDTAYQIRWNIHEKEKKPVMDILFGKIRTLIQKGGPRKGMKIRTRTMSLGVRGTDFFVVGRGKNGMSEISVLRGSVAVMPRTVKKAKAVVVTAGYSAEVKGFPVKPQKPKKTKKKKVKKEVDESFQSIVILRRTTKEDFIKIQKASVVSKKKSVKIEVQEDAKRVEALEKKAVKITLLEIKEEDPTLYAEISKDPKKLQTTDTDELHSSTVKKLFKKAPSKPENLKPGFDDLRGLGEDAYDKYFRIE